MSPISAAIFCQALVTSLQHMHLKRYWCSAVDGQPDHSPKATPPLQRLQHCMPSSQVQHRATAQKPLAIQPQYVWVQAQAVALGATRLQQLAANKKVHWLVAKPHRRIVSAPDDVCYTIAQDACAASAQTSRTWQGSVVMPGSNQAGRVC